MFVSGWTSEEEDESDDDIQSKGVTRSLHNCGKVMEISQHTNWRWCWCLCMSKEDGCGYRGDYSEKEIDS